MNGLKRLWALGARLERLAAERVTVKVDGKPLWRGLLDIAGQIECEQAEAVAWVREHGGLEPIKSSLSALELLAEGIEIDTGLAFYDESPKERCVALRNEVKSRLMPEGMKWPCFDDGEPVRIGDEAPFGSDGRMVVTGIELVEGGFVLHGRDGGIERPCQTGYKVGVRVKRPAPKVLDADGVEIRVGDEVWGVDGSGPFIVSGFVGEPLAVIFEIAECNDLPRKPSQLTHRAPVLAADGEPLEARQTVWHIDTGIEYWVKSGQTITSDAVVIIRKTDCDCESEIVKASQLTHQRPVLDAEGNRIEPAMDVWWVCEGDERGIHAEKLHVESIGEDGLVTCDPFNGGTWVELEPSELYVNKPVLAADGKPLREGETVYDKDTGDRFEVDGFSDGYVMCTDIDACESNLEILPSQLTHERPVADTWERVEEDARNIRTALLDSDRLPFEVVDERALDLVRRAKKLAGGDAS